MKWMKKITKKLKKSKKSKKSKKKDDNDDGGPKLVKVREKPKTRTLSAKTLKISKISKISKNQKNQKNQKKRTTMMMVVRSSSKSVKGPKAQKRSLSVKIKNAKNTKKNQKLQKLQKLQKMKREVLDYIGKEQTYHPKTKIPPRYSPSAPGAFIYLFIYLSCSVEKLVFSILGPKGFNWFPHPSRVFNPNSLCNSTAVTTGALPLKLSGFVDYISGIRSHKKYLEKNFKKRASELFWWPNTP